MTYLNMHTHTHTHSGRDKSIDLDPDHGVQDLMILIKLTEQKRSACASMRKYPSKLQPQFTISILVPYNELPKKNHG